MNGWLAGGTPWSGQSAEPGPIIAASDTSAKVAAKRASVGGTRAIQAMTGLVIST